MSPIYNSVQLNLLELTSVDYSVRLAAFVAQAVAGVQKRQEQIHSTITGI